MWLGSYLSNNHAPTKYTHVHYESVVAQVTMLFVFLPRAVVRTWYCVSNNTISSFQPFSPLPPALTLKCSPRSLFSAVLALIILPPNFTIQLFAVILPPPPKTPIQKHTAHLSRWEHSHFYFSSQSPFRSSTPKISKQIMHTSHLIMFISSQRALLSCQMLLLFSTAFQHNVSFSCYSELLAPWWSFYIAASTTFELV